MITEGSRWRHYKTATEYVVICVAEDVETKLRLVVYRALDVVGRTWARSEADFLGFAASGVRRFEPVKLTYREENDGWDDMRHVVPEEPPPGRPYMDD